MKVGVLSKKNRWCHDVDIEKLYVMGNNKQNISNVGTETCHRVTKLHPHSQFDAGNMFQKLEVWMKTAGWTFLQLMRVIGEWQDSILKAVQQFKNSVFSTLNSNQCILNISLLKDSDNWMESQ